MTLLDKPYPFTSATPHAVQTPLVHIPSIGLGTWGYGGFFTQDNSRDEEFISLIQQAIDLGMTFIDTAEAYGAGHCEILVGRAIRSRRQNVFLATKVSPEHLSRRDVVAAAEASLRRLGTDWLDVYQIHWPNPRIPLEETFEALTLLCSQGKVRFIGVSNFSAPEIVRAQALCPHRLASIQTEYNLFDRGAETELLPQCQAMDLALIAYSPLDQGKSLVGHQRNELLIRIARRHGKSTGQIILNWLASQGPVVPIVRTFNPKHLQENATALDFTLSPEEIQAIADAFPYTPKHIPLDQVLTDHKGMDTFTPGPDELARDILNGLPLKPIRVTASPDQPGKYILVEGKLRYWAFVYAYKGQKPVPALIR